MKIVIINCHWDNRGDEAAIRAMIDELRVKYPSADIYVQRALGEFGSFPENEHVKVLLHLPAPLYFAIKEDPHSEIFL